MESTTVGAEYDKGKEFLFDVFKSPCVQRQHGMRVYQKDSF
jgi:hypothetical protein